LVKKWKILRGDLVSVTTGRDKGKQGLVKKVLRHKNKLVVEGVNIIKKHVKKSPQNPGSIVKKESTIHYSNVKLICPETGKTTKIKYGYTNDRKKIRIAKRTNKVIPRPEILTKKSK